MKTDHTMCLLLGFLVIGSASAQERVRRSELPAAVGTNSGRAKYGSNRPWI
jgi:hypothetical protein